MAQYIPTEQAIASCTSVFETALRNIVSAGQSETKAVEERLTAVVTKLVEELGECKREIAALRKKDEEQGYEIAELRRQLAAGSAGGPSSTCEGVAMRDGGEETHLVGKDDVPAVGGLCDDDLNKRLQVRETGAVIVCLKRDATKFGWKKLKTEQMTASEIAYRDTVAETQPPAPPSVDTLFGAPSIPPTDSKCDDAASLFAPPSEPPQFWSTSQEPSSLGGRSISFPGTSLAESEMLPARSASFTFNRSSKEPSPTSFSSTDATWTTAPPNQGGWSS
eukprot:TRINITY_DN20842_c0_g1_i1.p2 TRINITY_DN20842_c0_g1~~TRINITY_DN20842_c0_g1_i1.p2  ORF type:complete len:278 (+),score=59.86 TRINITY_DN20842_c0_g1_i1:53-886(+)